LLLVLLLAYFNYLKLTISWRRCEAEFIDSNARMLVGLKIPKASLVALAFCLFAGFHTVLAQASRSEQRKFDEFGNERTSNVKARLDLFAEAMLNENLRGSLAGYRSGRTLAGSFLRELHGYREYLVNSSGVDPSRLDTIDGGVRESAMFELWLAPSGTYARHEPRQSSLASDLASDLPGQFDSLGIGSGCVGEYTLVLEEPEDALRIFAQALKENPGVKGFVLVHPSRSAPSQARKLVANSQAFLVNSGIPREQIITGIEAARHCADLSLWVAPASVVVPPRRIKSFFESELISEAERQQYSIRSVEFVNSQSIPDQTLRRRIPGLQEGERFTISTLEQNLVSLSKLRTIRPVRLEDIDVFLDKTNGSIDVWIHVNERRRSR
jgi:hypothetical protein